MIQCLICVIIITFTMHSGGIGMIYIFKYEQGEYSPWWMKFVITCKGNEALLLPT